MRKLTIGLLLMLALPVMADSVLFSCTTTNKKAIKVTQTGSKVKYVFGAAGKTPDLAFEVPRNKVKFDECIGTCGRYNSVSATIPNGQYAYALYYSVDRLEGHGVDAGVHVSHGEKYINTVKCSNKSRIINNLNELE